MKITLIRHGETQHNMENRMSGWTEANLSPLGKHQASMLAERLRYTEVDKVLTSGMIRANETAEIIFRHHKQHPQIEVLDSLKEMNFGIMESMTMAEIQSAFPADYAEMIQKKGVYSFPEGESLYTFHQRIKKAADKLLNMDTVNHLVVVAHAGTIRSLLAEWITDNWNNHWRFQIDHCSISIIEFYEGFPVLITSNDIAHLEEDNSSSNNLTDNLKE
jgi:broad specificity phosphatase PhoE